ncbi:MAG: hypothetical protein IKN46_02880, partial [Acholeplasmatales bacterium]|nr:hypothetical protein [Acholeplasmatales bacterium]
MGEILVLDNKLFQYESIDYEERAMIDNAKKLINVGFPDHALLEIWNASIHNLRRRVEAYSVEMFTSNIKEFSGRKNYKVDGDSLSERWSGVDDEVLINGACQIGVLNKKASQALKMIEWNRNHATPAHDSDENVTEGDVLGLSIILSENLFSAPIPSAVHSPVAIINPLKNDIIPEDKIQVLIDQINDYKNKEILMLFGFGIDAIEKGDEPTYSNIKQLFPTIWNKATENQKNNMGIRYHNHYFSDETDTSSRDRLFEMLVKVGGIGYVPDSSRAAIYRKYAKELASAKDSSYGWANERKAANALKQIGVNVPSIAFEEVYQEILASWCGNYWGTSNSSVYLEDFIFKLKPNDKVRVCKLFISNLRVKDELCYSRPKNVALKLLRRIKDTLDLVE